MNMPPILVLAAGHGGKDTGAVSRDFKSTERDQAIRIVDRAANILNGMGVKTIIAPHHHDTHETIPWLKEQGYGWGDIWAVEVHRDSAETIKEPDASWRCGIYRGTSTFSTKVANKYLLEMKRLGAHPTSWVRADTESGHGRLGWIRQPEALSHLVELGFMEGSNDPLHIERLAAMLAEALAVTMRFTGF